MSLSLTGFFAPVVTTFAQDGEALDLAGFARNIGAHLSAGCAGVLVAGSTGEAALLREHERVALLEAARAVVPAGSGVIAGVGAESTSVTVERAHAARDAGADAVLVVGPHYYPESATAEALLAHYARIADESPIPVLLYNIPKYMHYAIPPAVVSELAGHPNIAGMKDSSGDASLLSAYLQSQSHGFTVLTGNGSTLLAAIRGGVRGAILAVALFAPEVVAALWQTAIAGRWGEAAEWQQRLLPLARDIVGSRGVPGVKAAMDAIGLSGGAVRPPLRPLTAEQRDLVRNLVQKAVLTRPSAQNASDPVASVPQRAAV